MAGGSRVRALAARAVLLLLSVASCGRDGGLTDLSQVCGCRIAVPVPVPVLALAFWFSLVVVLLLSFPVADYCGLCYCFCCCFCCCCCSLVFFLLSVAVKPLFVICNCHAVSFWVLYRSGRMRVH